MGRRRRGTSGADARFAKRAPYLAGVHLAGCFGPQRTVNQLVPVGAFVAAPSPGGFIVFVPRRGIGRGSRGRCPAFGLSTTARYTRLTYLLDTLTRRGHDRCPTSFKGSGRRRRVRVRAGSSDAQDTAPQFSNFDPQFVQNRLPSSSTSAPQSVHTRGSSLEPLGSDRPQAPQNRWLGRAGLPHVGHFRAMAAFEHRRGS